VDVILVLGVTKFVEATGELDNEELVTIELT
jgi:hypothetical protein